MHAPLVLTPPHEEHNACANAIGASSLHFGDTSIHLVHPLPNLIILILFFNNGYFRFFLKKNSNYYVLFQSVIRVNLFLLFIYGIKNIILFFDKKNIMLLK